MDTRSASTSRPCRGCRRRDTRRRTWNRDRAGRDWRNRHLYRAQHTRARPAALGLRPPRNDRGDSGTGHASRRDWHCEVVDHLDSAEVKRLADDIHRTHGHIDMLVNDIWGAEVLKGGPSEWNTPLWKHDLQKGLRILRLGVETHLITSHHLLSLVIARPGGLLVEVTDGTFEYNVDPLPVVHLLRFGEDLRQSPGILPGTRARAARCHGGVDQSRVAAFRDDARELRRVRRTLA